MKIALVFTLFFIVFNLKSQSINTFPQYSISNGLISVTSLLPDENKGYYRGTRFDWSGVISSLTWNGHEFFGKWFPAYDPKLHDAIMGPVDMYQPIGYNDAKVGETFLMIGVGLVQKLEDKRYSIAPYYPIVNSGIRKLSKNKHSITYYHDLSSNKYSYTYKKQVILVKDKPILMLKYSLKNSGKDSLSTRVYNHNFFMIDAVPTGPDIEVRYTFAPTGVADAGSESLARFEQNKLVFNKIISSDPPEYFQVRDIYGWSGIPLNYDFHIINHKSKVGVHITSDRPLSKMAVWAIHTTVCPEPFIDIKLAKGEKMDWYIKYEFYNF